MNTLNDEQREGILNDENQFRMYVMQSLGELKSGLKEITGNGQPGRLTKLEQKVSRHDWFLGLAVGGAAVIGYLLSYGVNLSPVVFGR